jgi:hypothetical protein
VKELPDPRRWSADGADVPSELGRMLRAGRDELGTADEVAELARRLSAELGSAAGLSVRDPLPAASGSAPSGFARLGARSLGRAAAWVGAGAGAVAAVWFAASSLSSVSPPEPPTSERPAAPDRVGEASTVAPAVPPPAPAAVRAADAAAPAPAEIDPAEPRPAAGQGTARSGARASRGARALAEAALLERAQAALSGNPASALALTREHQRRFPSGALGQEREVIAIEALKRLGRKEAANARAAAFERRYRGSVHRPRVERSTDTSSPEDGDWDTAP